MGRRVGNIFLAERKALDNGAQKVSLIDADGWREVFGEDSLGLRSSTSDVSMDKLYHTVSWLNRCVRIRANALSSLPWEIVPEGADLDTEPIFEQGQEPPQDLAWAKNLPLLIYKFESSQLLQGAGYAFKKYTNGRLEELRWWNPRTVEPIMTPQGIAGYKRSVNKRDKNYPSDEVVAVFAPDIYVEQGPGYAVAESARDHARAIRALSGFAADYLDNGALVHTFLGIKGNLTSEQRSDYEKTWIEKLTGWSRGKRVHIVNADAITPQRVGEGLGEITNEALSKHERESICTALDVPFSMASMTRSDGAAVEADQYGLYTGSVIPSGWMFQMQLNDQLFKELGYTFRFRPEKHEIMQKAEVAKAQQVMALVGEPVLTVDEGRGLMGYEPLGGESVSVEQAQESELRAWYRKAKRKGRAVEFVPKHLEDWQAAVIRQRLDDGQELDQVFTMP